MENASLRLAKSYFAGSFSHDDLQLFQGQQTDPERFENLNRQWHHGYDDWYRGHYAHYGDRLNAIKAIIANENVAFRETFDHLTLCYKNCAISSGTNPHLDAVMHAHHTSDKLSRVIGSDKHTWQNIKDNSARSLARAQKVHPLFPEVYLFTPSALEGSTQILHGSGRTLTGGLPFDAAAFMSFWYMKIDMCEAFILDDITLDRPPIERVIEEITLAQSGSTQMRERVPIVTSDWANSRNSILEMARGLYIRFGLHPLRPDMTMDMRLYDEASHSLYDATLVDCVKPALQNILRWAPQGIAVEEAARTTARLFNLHRMRTNPDYNALQMAPLDLPNLPPILRDPSQSEIQEMNHLMERFEPFLLRYSAHLIRPEGLPEIYADAKSAMPVQARHRGNDILNGKEIMQWQRQNIPVEEIKELWDLTQPRRFKPTEAYPKRAPLVGDIKPQRRLHSFDPKDAPFAPPHKAEIWPDNPFSNLSEMEQDLARMTIGVLETGLLPLDSPDYHGLRYDMKRGIRALEIAREHGIADIALLPGALNKTFTEKVSEPNLAQAVQLLNDMKICKTKDGQKIAQAAFGAPDILRINQTINAIRPDLTGPGPQTPSADFRLALEMEMLRRNLTHIRFQDGWETSENAARMMILATKMQFGKIKRPAGNDRELSVLNEKGEGLSLFERFDKLSQYLENLLSSPDIQEQIHARNADALQDLGVKHISLALAHIIELYDCLKDPQFNAGRFELQQVLDSENFTRDIDQIQKTKSSAMQNLMEHWVWLWDEEDFDEKNLRRDYRDAWLKTHGRHSQNIGPPAIDDFGINTPYAR